MHHSPAPTTTEHPKGTPGAQYTSSTHYHPRSNMLVLCIGGLLSGLVPYSWPRISSCVYSSIHAEEWLVVLLPPPSA
jgi:hypothetical protein